MWRMVTPSTGSHHHLIVEISRQIILLIDIQNVPKNNKFGRSKTIYFLNSLIKFYFDVGRWRKCRSFVNLIRKTKLCHHCQKLELESASPRSLGSATLQRHQLYRKWSNQEGDATQWKDYNGDLLKG